MNNSDNTLADHDQSGRYEQHQFGEYQVRYKIGEGGMAEVYQAEHPSFGMVALKVLKPSGVKNNDTLNRFIREAQTINKLHHPHIVTIYETGQIWFQPTQQTVPFIAMEYLSGGTLSDRLNHQQTLDFMLKVGEDIGSALDYAHGKKIIHRDIKPSNILFRKDGKVFLADFGIALVSDQDRLTHTGGFAGTLAYTAPEVFRNQTADARSDIYALGLILYEALSGKHPYYTAADSIPRTIGKILSAPIPYLPDLAPLVPVRTAEVIAQATAREPSQRFATMADFIEALKQSKYHQARSIPNQPIPQAPSRVAPTREQSVETTVYTKPSAPTTRSRTMPGRPIMVARSSTSSNMRLNTMTLNLLSVPLYCWFLLSNFWSHVFKKVYNIITGRKYLLLDIVIYLQNDDPSAVQQLYENIKNLIEDENFDVKKDFPAIKGSWFKKLIIRSKDVLTKQETTERLKKLERALELITYIGKEAEVNATQSTAVLNLVQAIENQPNAVIQIGTLIVIKITHNNIPQMIVRQLSLAEVRLIERNQNLLQKPQELFQVLSQKNGQAHQQGVTPDNPITPLTQPQKNDQEPLQPSTSTTPTSSLREGYTIAHIKNKSVSSNIASHGFVEDTQLLTNLLLMEDQSSVSEGHQNEEI